MVTTAGSEVSVSEGSAQQGERRPSPEAEAMAIAFNGCFSPMSERVIAMMRAGSNYEDLVNSRERARKLIVDEHGIAESHSSIVIKFRTCVGILVAIYRKDTRKTVRTAIAAVVRELDTLCFESYSDTAVVTDAAHMVLESAESDSSPQGGGCGRVEASEEAQANV